MEGTRPGTKKWSDSQRATVLRLMFEENMIPREAVYLCKTESVDGLEPFDMPEGTAADYRKVQRRRLAGGTLSARAKKADIRTTHELLIRQALTVADKRLERMTTSKGKPAKFEREDYRAIAQSLKNLAEATRAIDYEKAQPPRAPKRKAGKGTAQEQSDSFWTKLREGEAAPYGNAKRPPNAKRQSNGVGPSVSEAAEESKAEAREEQGEPVRVTTATAPE